MIEYQIASLFLYVSVFGLPVSEDKKLISQAGGLIQLKLIKGGELSRPLSHSL